MHPFLGLHADAAGDQSPAKHKQSSSCGYDDPKYTKRFFRTASHRWATVLALLRVRSISVRVLHVDLEVGGVRSRKQCTVRFKPSSSRTAANQSIPRRALDVSEKLRRTSPGRAGPCRTLTDGTPALSRMFTRRYANSATAVSAFVATWRISPWMFSAAAARRMASLPSKPAIPRSSSEETPGASGYPILRGLSGLCCTARCLAAHYGQGGGAKKAFILPILSSGSSRH